MDATHTQAKGSPTLLPGACSHPTLPQGPGPVVLAHPPAPAFPGRERLCSREGTERWPRLAPPAALPVVHVTALQPRPLLMALPLPDLSPPQRGKETGRPKLEAKVGEWQGPRELWEAQTQEEVQGQGPGEGEKDEKQRERNQDRRDGERVDTDPGRACAQPCPGPGQDEEATVLTSQWRSGFTRAEELPPPSCPGQRQVPTQPAVSADHTLAFLSCAAQADSPMHRLLGQRRLCHPIPGGKAFLCFLSRAGQAAYPPLGTPDPVSHSPPPPCPALPKDPFPFLQGRRKASGQGEVTWARGGPAATWQPPTSTKEGPGRSGARAEGGTQTAFLQGAPSTGRGGNP